MTTAADLDATNLFIVLGKYVQRQDENLLTQSLVLLFNRSGAFRKNICNRLSATGAVSSNSVGGLRAYSQVRRAAHGKNLIVDMEIRPVGNELPLYLVECKLDAGLGNGQIAKYALALKKFGGKTKLVVITRHGVDDRLTGNVPRGTVWLSWSVVAELAQRAMRQAPKLDRLLLRDFIDMLKAYGIEMLPPVTLRNWARLKKLSKFAMVENSNRLNYWSLAAAELAFRRLIAFRDAAWEGVLGEAGNWRPHQAVWKLDDYVVLYASFYLERPSKHVSETALGLELICNEKPKMRIVEGRFFASTHPKYEKGDSSYEWEHRCYTRTQTRRLFSMPIGDGIEEMRSDTRAVVKKYLKSAFAKK